MVVPVDGATQEALGTADLVVVGGPTHIYGMSTKLSRKGARDDAAKPDRDLELDPDAEGPGLRGWFESVTALPAKGAAFDTRMTGPPAMTGRASKGIAKRLRHHGCELVGEPTSFLVTKDNRLLDAEREHAVAWGAQLGAVLGGSG